MGFHPGYEVDTCPICGAKLVVKEFMGYGINSGYFSECPNCHLYDDIWACGIRELNYSAQFAHRPSPAWQALTYMKPRQR